MSTTKSPARRVVDTPDPTFTLAASQLHALLSPVLPFADKGDTLPILEAVQVRSSGEYLYATATDRYRLGVQRVKVDNLPEGLDFVLSRATVRGILALHKPSRRDGDPELTITVFTHVEERNYPSEGTKVRVADRVTVSGGGSFGFLDSSTSWPVVSGEYPKVNGILREAAERASKVPEGVVGAAFNPAYLADFRLAQPPHSTTPMVLFVGSGRLATLVRIGDDFIGAIMPVRWAADRATDELDEAWNTALGVPATEEPKAVNQ